MRDNAEYRWATQAIRVLLLFASAIALEGSSCLTGAIQGPTDKITQSFDNAIANLQNQSGQWQATLQGLQSNLVQQGQSTLANEVQSVLNRGVAATSSEFRCDISFLGSYLAEALTIVRAHFHNESPPPPPPHVCNVDPDAIDLRLTPDRRPATLNLYGFNFTGSNISISIVDVDGSHNTPAPGMFTVPTEFKATFNIVNYPFASTSRYVSFMLPGGEERRVSIAQAPSCGGVDQPCCSVGQVCDFGSGCLANRCVTCPPPSAPPVPVLAFTKG